MQAGLSAPIQGVEPLKGGISLRGPSNDNEAVMPVLGLHVELDILENEATPSSMLVAI